MNDMFEKEHVWLPDGDIAEAALYSTPAIIVVHDNRNHTIQ